MNKKSLNKKAKQWAAYVLEKAWLDGWPDDDISNEYLIVDTDDDEVFLEEHIFDIVDDISD